MPSGSEQEGLWSPESGGAHAETFNGLELAEAATAPARLEDQPVDYAQADQGDPAAEPAASPNERGTAAPARRRGRGGRPRVSADQDRRIVEAFERAKDQGRSLKDVAQDLAKELGQPPEYINQRYYYLRRRTRPAEPEAAARPAGGRRRRAAAAPVAEAPRPVGRRRMAAARPAEPVAGEAQPARRRGRVVALAGVEDRLAQLSDIATRQLAALTERMERIEERLSELERRPAAQAAASDEELYNRLGRMLVRAAFGALEGGR